MGYDYGAWYSLAAWRGPNGRRKQQLQAEPLCRFCMQMGFITAAKVADHIEPHRGDFDQFMNGELQSLCEPCHNVAKQQIETFGYTAMSGLDGYPVDPNHPSNKRR